MVPLLGTEFVPKADFSETTVNFYTPVGSSLEVTEAKARQVDAHPARDARGALHAHHHQHRQAPQGKTYASIYVRLVDRKDRSAASTRCRCRCASGCARCPASPSPMSACSMPVGGQKQIEFSLQGPDLAELERLTRR
jgi:HAE1 family hydrophobic/amphiphilic exporter-1